MCLWNEPTQVSQSVVFTEYDWKYHIYLNIKTEERKLKIWLFNYLNNFFLDSVETYFLEVGGYVSVKRVTTGVWEVGLC